MVARVGQTTRQRLSTQQLATQRALLRTQTRYMTQPIRTAPIAKASPAPISSTGFFARIQNSISSNWGAFKNWWTFKAPTPAPSPVPSTSFKSKLPVIPQPLSMPVPKELMEQPVSPIGSSTIAQLKTAQSLSKMKTILKKQGTVARNKLQKLFKISSEKWQNAMQRIESLSYTMNNYFKNTNTKAKHDNMPENLHNRIITLSQMAGINPNSFAIHWRKIIASDQFGHNDIIVDENEIPTITLDPDKVTALSPEDFDERFVHTLGHLKEAHEQQLNVIIDTVGMEDFKQQIENPDLKAYLASLETQADLNPALDSEAIAEYKCNSIVQKTFEYFFKKTSSIKPTMSHQDVLSTIAAKIGEPQYENIGEIRCQPPGQEFIDFIQEINSIDEIEKVCQKKRKDILASLGFTNAQQEEYFKELNATDKRWKENKQRVKGFHTKEMPEHLMTLTKTLLTQSGIEPSSLNIELESGKNTGGSVTWFPFASLPTLRINPLLEDNDIFATRMILHEIGHLLKHHSTELFLLNHYCKKYSITADKTLAGVLAIKKLVELEADTFLATTHPDVAKLQQIASKEELFASKIQSWFGEVSPLHPTATDRLNIYKKILQLHKKEKNSKQKLFFEAKKTEKE